MEEQIIATINQTVDQKKAGLFALSQDIHDHPELGYHEFQTVQKILTYLQEQGVQGQDNFFDIPTSFHATYGEGHPNFAILAEYDALPKIGHGCGHNVIATAAIGAFLACQAAMQKYHIVGQVTLMGTPAEEGGGGKIKLLDRGAFQDIDAATMVHPTSGTTRIAGRCTATHDMTIEYHGQGAHAASQPFKGKNALDAATLFFTAVGLLRQQLTSDVRLSGILVDGGNVTNVIPDYTKIKYSLRCLEESELPGLITKIKNCAQAAALATGCEVQITEKSGYGARTYNQTLGNICRTALEDLGEPVLAGFPDDFGSTDFGNISQVMPTTNPYFSLHKTRLSLHTAEYEKLAGTEVTHKAITRAAKAMARTVIECLVNPEILKQAQAEKSAAANLDERPR